ncbi:MAG: GAF domain-containing sensor histidine kinase [Anaerolineales bacterium]|nr:GAF domain-containing sensor histidine kinase [Anaerolineales bacterium]
MTNQPNDPRPNSKLHPLRRNQTLWGVVACMFIIVGIFGGNTGSLAAAVVGALASVVGYLFEERLRVYLEVRREASNQEIKQLQTATQRSRAVYDLASRLGATLNYQYILEAAQEVGILALREPDTERRMVSAALLFRNEDNRLWVASSKRLTLADEKKSLAGQQGLLGQALTDGEPVFGDNPHDDPELGYYASFQNMQSVVVIPLRAGYRNYGALIFGTPEPDAFAEDAAGLLSTIGTQATIALQNAVLYESLFNEKERIVQVEEDARKKLSRDLHDGPTQTVSVIAMRVSVIQGMIRSGQLEKASDELKKVGELANRTTKEIRYMLFAMRPLVLENQGLIAALDDMAKKMHETYELPVTIQAQPEVERVLDDNAQGALFYVVEEGVNNARKHAQASQIYVRLYQRGQYCMVEIEDNGVGFDVAQVNTNYHKRGSLGMVSMRERAELANGELHLQSEKGRGTRISIRIPIPEEYLSKGAALLQNVKQQTKPNVELSETRFHRQISPDPASPSASSSVTTTVPEQVARHANPTDEDVPTWGDLLGSSNE